MVAKLRHLVFLWSSLHLRDVAGVSMDETSHVDGSCSLLQSSARKAPMFDKLTEELVQNVTKATKEGDAKSLKAAEFALKKYDAQLEAFLKYIDAKLGGVKVIENKTVTVSQPLHIGVGASILSKLTDIAVYTQSAQAVTAALRWRKLVEADNDQFLNTIESVLDDVGVGPSKKPSVGKEDDEWKELEEDELEEEGSVMGNMELLDSSAVVGERLGGPERGIEWRILVEADDDQFLDTIESVLDDVEEGTNKKPSVGKDDDEWKELDEDELEEERSVMGNTGLLDGFAEENIRHR